MLLKTIQMQLVQVLLLHKSQKMIPKLIVVLLMIPFLCLIHVKDIIYVQIINDRDINFIFFFISFCHILSILIESLQSLLCYFIFFLFYFIIFSLMRVTNSVLFCVSFFCRVIFTLYFVVLFVSFVELVKVGCVISSFLFSFIYVVFSMLVISGLYLFFYLVLLYLFFCLVLLYLFFCLVLLYLFFCLVSLYCYMGLV